VFGPRADIARARAGVALPFAARGKALRDLYDVVAKHVRHELQGEIASEACRIEDARETPD
jgi:hypothetical protein